MLEVLRAVDGLSEVQTVGAEARGLVRGPVEAPAAEGAASPLPGVVEGPVVGVKSLGGFCSQGYLDALDMNLRVEVRRGEVEVQGYVCYLCTTFGGGGNSRYC